MCESMTGRGLGGDDMILCVNGFHFTLSVEVLMVVKLTNELKLKR